MTAKDQMAMRDILVGAQQAYAYLHGFHTRLSDTVSQLVAEIGKTLGQDLAFAKASKINNNHPSFRQNPFDRNARWVWDWLPLYEFTVLYTDEASDRHGTLIVEMRFEADTRWQGESDAAPVISDASADHASLTLYAWHKAGKGEDWREAWDNTDWPEDVVEVAISDRGFRCIRLDVNLLDMASESAVHAEGRRLADEIAERLNLRIG